MIPRREETLRMLLASLFGSNTTEFRIFLTDTCEPDLPLHLPAEGAPPFILIGKAVETLHRRGALGPEFFAALRRHFPLKALEIDREGVLWASGPSSEFFPPVVTLEPSLGPTVSLIAWQLRLHFHPPLDLTDSALAKLLRECGRTIKWPYVLVQPPERASFTRSRESLHWSSAVPTGLTNRRGDQHVQVSAQRSLVVQRDTLTDQQMIDFDDFAADVPRFLRFARSVHASLNRSEPLQVSVELIVSPADHERPVLFENRLRMTPNVTSVRYSGSGVTLQRSIDPTRLDDIAGLSAECHRILEGIVNEFTFVPSLWNSEPADILGLTFESVEQFVRSFYLFEPPGPVSTS